MKKILFLLFALLFIGNSFGQNAATVKMVHNADGGPDICIPMPQSMMADQPNAPSTLVYFNIVNNNGYYSQAPKGPSNYYKY